MDHRIALKPNTVLHLYTDKGEEVHCVVEEEIGRGSSCIVYEASRNTQSGDKSLYRVKEYYPYKLNISRNNNNWLVPSEENREIFDQGKKQFCQDFSVTCLLFYSGRNYSAMTNALDVFHQNGTAYILSAYSSRRTLAEYKPASIKECITLVRQTAYVLGNLHKQGYLYLDIKPDNILVIDGFQKQIQLFDFDSLLPIAAIPEKGKSHNRLRISYSEGFAPIELQMAKVSQLGTHTDVYGIGALLFYLLFGDTPKAPDCEEDASFDFWGMKYDSALCDDRMFFELADFFHHSLAVYYEDRTSDMQAVLEQLVKAEHFADTTIPRIYSTKIIRPRFLYGREREFQELDLLLANTNHHCIFLTGMGGIGKSSFIREYLHRHREEYDTVLYIPYKDSIEAAFSDDRNIEINTLHQKEDEKSSLRYFDRKLQKFRELVRGTSSILVIDNFTGRIDEDLKAILETDLKVVLITRRAFSCQSSLEMRLPAISDRQALQQIFEINLGRKLCPDEQSDFECILQCIERHTLVLELIAKQIAGSHITIEKAAALVKENGFSQIAAEKIAYEKDNMTSSDTIETIIEVLFEAGEMSVEKKRVLRAASLHGDHGVLIHDLRKLLKITSFDSINELIQEGWLMLNGETVFMHRVIQETVRRRKWTDDFSDMAEQLLTYYYVEIHIESTKNNYPKKLDSWLKAFQDEPHQTLFQKRKREQVQRVWQKGLSGKIMLERLARVQDDSPADMKKLEQLLIKAEEIVAQCKKEPVLRSNEMCAALYHIMILNTPRYREAYLIRETNDILSSYRDDFVMKGTLELLNEETDNNPYTKMQLYALVFEIYEGKENWKEAGKLLNQAKQFAEKARSSRVYAVYYDLLADYYDGLLDGAYDAETDEEKKLLNELLAAMKKTLHFSRIKHSYDYSHLYIRTLLGMVSVLLRSSGAWNKKISVLMEKAHKCIEEDTLPYAEVRLDYYIVSSWYHAFVQNSEETVNDLYQKTMELADIILPTDKEKLERICIPFANIYFEMENASKAIQILYKGTRVCCRYPEVMSYVHIKQELCEHIWQVGIEAHAYAQCQTILNQIDCDNGEIADCRNRVIVPEEIRKNIQNGIKIN